MEGFITFLLPRLTKYSFFQVRTVSASYIMKGDDDTFVRVDAIINEARKVREGRSLYIGNINYSHKPLRSGKWAVTYEVTTQILFFRFLFFRFMLRIILIFLCK